MTRTRVSEIEMLTRLIDWLGSDYIILSNTMRDKGEDYSRARVVIHHKVCGLTYETGAIIDKVHSRRCAPCSKSGKHVGDNRSTLPSISDTTPPLPIPDNWGKTVDGFPASHTPQLVQGAWRWRKVVGFPNYSISNYGIIRKDRTGKRLATGNRNGYRMISLTYNKERKTIGVHRLVATAFIPNPYNLPLVHHIDENPSNNRLDNLQWANNSYNASVGTVQERKRITQARNKGQKW